MYIFSEPARWGISSAVSGSKKLEELLDDGWEPFGVVMVPTNGHVYYYLKKVVG